MEQEKPILGYVVCRTCMTPKAIKPGKGKRSAFVHARCECGSDNRTGVAVQKKMNAYKTLEEVQAEIEAMSKPKEPESKPIQSQPEPEKQPESEPNQEIQSEGVSTVGCIGIGAVLGLVFGGAFKLIKAVA